VVTQGRLLSTLATDGAIMTFIRRTQGPGSHGYLKGGHRPPEYRIWSTMIQRCLNPSCREYPWYGGRGIQVCARWLEANGFANLLADLGPQPFRRASLHRLDNDGDYEPGNVCWADPRTQMRHTRRNRVLTHDGRSMVLVEWAEALGIKPVTLGQRLMRHTRRNRVLTHDGRSMVLVEWAEALGIKPVTLGQRLNKGWSVARALTEAVRHRRPYAEWVRRNPHPRKPGPKPRRPGADGG
jgi:hypothetical protein